MRKIIIAGLLIFSSAPAFSQSFSINTTGATADASAMLDIASTTKGLLIPRMSRAERDAIVSPATGLLIFQNGPDSIGLHYYDGSKWTWMFSNSNSDSLAWKAKGNTGTNPANHFLGTTDNVPLVIKTNNAEKLRLTTNGELAIGTSTPNSTYGFAKVEIASEGLLSPTDLLIRNAVNHAGYAPGLVFQHARGTLAAPLAVNNGDYLTAIASMNHDGSNYIQSAGIDMYTDAAISPGIVPTRIHFNTMNSVGSYAARLTIKNNGRVGIGTTNPLARTHISGGNFLADGVFGTDSTLAFSGAGTKMFFYPRKAALRAGNVGGTQWDDANIGDYSIGLGVNAQAKSGYSISIGEANIAETSPFAVAIGRQNHSTGFASLAMGHFSEASGDYSVSIGLRDTVASFGGSSLGAYNKITSSGFYGFAAGESNTVSGGNAVAAGFSNNVSSYASFALGMQNTATGFVTFVAGRSNYATGNHSAAFGFTDSSSADQAFTSGMFNTVKGNNSAAFGSYNYAPSYGEVTIGNFATQYTALNATGINAADRVFTVGNGTSAGSRSNAMMILKNGNVGIGNITPGSSLTVNGSIAGAVVITASSLTLNNTHYCVIYNGGTGNTFNLPAASTCTGRMYVIINHGTDVLTTDVYRVGNATTSTTVFANDSVQIISDGTEWRKIK